MQKFLVQIQRSIPNTHHANRTTSEQYLVEDETIAAAEARILQEVEAETSIIVSKVSSSKKYADIIRCTSKQDTHFYNVKAECIFLDERSQKEKRKAFYTLIEAENVNHANFLFEQMMKGVTSNYETISITKTPIVDVLKNNTNL